LPQGIYGLRQLADADERAEASADTIMAALDRDGDGQLSAREFSCAAAKHPTIADIIDGKAS